MQSRYNMDNNSRLRYLGASTVAVPPLIFGTASVAGLYQRVSATDARSTLEAAWSHGIRCFDTAPEYGMGLGERRLGDFLRDKPADEFLLCTKTGERLYPEEKVNTDKFIDPLPFSCRFDFSAEGIRRGLEDTFQRLGMNRIDLLLIHDLDPVRLGADEYYRHLEVFRSSGLTELLNLKKQGIVQAIGMGIKYHPECVELLDWMPWDTFMLQGACTMLEQPGLNFIELCHKKNISVFIAGPFASGILATGSEKPGYFHHKPAPQPVQDKVREIETICQSYGVPLPAAALHYPLRFQGVTALVCGFHNVQQIEQACKWLNETVPEPLWQSLVHHQLISQ